MDLFNFHHHNNKILSGIYNLNSIDETFESLFSMGIHPHKINADWEKSFDKLCAIAHQEHCVAIGECGLDGLSEVPQSLQAAVFISHIELANTLQKPVIIHCVRKFNEINNLKKLAKTPWVIHGFNRNENIATMLINSGFYLSFGKPLLQNISLQEIFRKTPVDKIFIETDNSDADIQQLYLKGAEIKNCSMDELQNQININLKTIINAR